MNAEALLGLISELYANLGKAGARIAELEAENAKPKPPTEAEATYVPGAHA